MRHHTQVHENMSKFGAKCRYDPERVPALPMHQEERSKYSTLNAYYNEASGKQTSSDGCSSSEQQNMGTELNTALSDVQLTRRDSHHFLASLIESTSSMADGSLQNKVRITIEIACLLVNTPFIRLAWPKIHFLP